MQIKANTIKSARERKHWSQEELAIAAGVSVRTVQRAEAKSSASLPTLKSLASALELQLNEVLINENRPMELEGRSPLKKWLLVGLLFFLLIPGSLITWQFLPKSTYELPSNWDELPLEEKILGHWETVFNGAKNTLNLDGTYTNPVGRVSGNARYTIRDDIISFGYNGRIISSRIVFISPTEMIWRSVENNAIVARYQRDPISMPTSAEVLEQLVGAWQELDGEGYLTIDNDKVSVKFANNPAADSYYQLNNNRLAINSESGPIVYIVNFFADETMTLHVPNTNKQMTMIRAR